MLQCLGLLRKVSYSTGCLFHYLGSFSRNGGYLLDRMVNFLTGRRLLFTSGCNRLHLIIYHVDKFQNLLERFAGLNRKLCSFFNQVFTNNQLLRFGLLFCSVRYNILT